MQNINVEHQFDVHWSVHRKNISICIQQDATLRSLFYLKTALHVSGGTITHHQERKQLYLQHLLVATPLLLSADSSNAVTNENKKLFRKCKMAVNS
jgi:hypothetical protein